MDKLFDRLQMLEDRYEELGELLSDPDVIADTKRFMELSKEMADLRETVEKYNKYKQVIQQIKDDEEMLGAGLDDDEMTTMVKEELASSKTEKEQLEEEIKILLLPKDLMMIKTSSWRSVALLVGMKRVCLRAIYSRCIASMLNIKAGISKLSTRL